MCFIDLTHWILLTFYKVLFNRWKNRWCHQKPGHGTQVQPHLLSARPATWDKRSSLSWYPEVLQNAWFLFSGTPCYLTVYTHQFQIIFQPINLKVFKLSPRKWERGKERELRGGKGKKKKEKRIRERKKKESPADQKGAIAAASV